MSVVEFTKDCYPYCKGDRIELSAAELKDVDALAEKRDVTSPYKVVADPSVPAPVDVVEAVSEPAAEAIAPLNTQKEAEANLVAPGAEAAVAAGTDKDAKADAKKK